jgi:hypothetical protein
MHLSQELATLHCEFEQRNFVRPYLEYPWIEYEPAVLNYVSHLPLLHSSVDACLISNIVILLLNVYRHSIRLALAGAQRAKILGDAYTGGHGFKFQ